MAGINRRSLLGWISAALVGIGFGGQEAVPELVDGPIFAYPPLGVQPEWVQLVHSAPDEFKFYQGFETLTLQGVTFPLDGGFPMPEPGGDNAGRRQDD